MYLRKIIILVLIIATAHIYAMSDKTSKSFDVEGAFKDAPFLYKCMHMLTKPLSHSSIVEKRNSEAINPEILQAYYAPKSPSKFYEDIGIRAQADLGIPVEKQLPIMKMIKLRIEAAVINRNMILFNEAFLNEKPTSVKRFVAYHEAVHSYYNDPATMEVLVRAKPYSVLPTGFALWSLYMLRKRPHIWPFALLPGLSLTAIGRKSENLYGLFCENRADRIGAYATQCHRCAHETASGRGNDATAKGYLSREELFNIADELKKCNLICDEHKVSLNK